MAHQDKTLAAIQTKVATTPSLPLHPADTKALVTQIPTFADAALGRKIAYASQHNITVNLSSTEMTSLLQEIARTSK